MPVRGCTLPWFFLGGCSYYKKSFQSLGSRPLRAQEAARDALAPEIVAGDIDAAAREPITQAGFGEAFAHGTGHGVGLEIHEQPMLSAHSSSVLLEHAVVTVEPGIYLPGRGGVRIEDTVVVAHAQQVLTEMQRGLTRVG